MVKKKKQKFNIVGIVSLLFFLGIVYCSQEIISDFLLFYETKLENMRLKKEYEELVEENETLSDQKDKLEDEEYIKEYVRQAYMLTKEGETIFIFPRK